MNKILIFALFLVSCAPTFPAIKAGNGSNIYFCGQANYLFHHSIPTKQLIPIYSAFQYWNAILDKKVFDGEEKHDTHIYVAIDKTMAKSAVWARTEGHVNDNGCLTTAIIILNPDVFSLTNEEIETIMRHEIGHTLSLDESFMGVQAMLPELPLHPLPVSQEQVDYIKQNVLRD